MAGGRRAERGRRGPERKLSQGSSERLYTPTQTNRWTGLEEQRQANNSTGGFSYLTAACQASNQLEYKWHITIPCLLCFVVFSSHLSLKMTKGIVFTIRNTGDLTVCW